MAQPPADDQGGSSRQHPDSVLTVSFEEPLSANESQLILDDGRAAVLAGASGGNVRLVEVSDGDETFARFPEPCATNHCPRAYVRIGSDVALNPGRWDFSYGARVRLQPAETAANKGANVVQKGRFGTEGGQWKLQVDSAKGRPSCVVQGMIGDRRAKAYVASEATIRDGRWHDVACHRHGDRLSIEVDGVTTTVTKALGTVGNTSPVLIGSPGLHQADDQFHGEIDDVFLTVSPDAEG